VLIEKEDWRNVGFAYMNLGVIYAQQNDVEQSYEYFVKCAETMQRTADPIAIAQSLNNLAIILETRGQVDEAQAMHENALEIRRGIKDKRGIAYSLSNLAALFLGKDRRDESRKMQQEALQLVREVGDQKAQSNILDSLGLLEFGIENYELALSYFEDAVRVGQAINNPFMLNKALRHLGNTQQKLGYDDFYTFYYESLRIVQNTGLLPDKLSNLFLLSECEVEKGKQDQAVQYLSLIMKHADAYQNIEEVKDKLEALKQTMGALVYETTYQTGQNQELDTVIDAILQEYEGQND
jgi:tetratricopeptide (TPR) repeat protein